MTRIVIVAVALCAIIAALYWHDEGEAQRKLTDKEGAENVRDTVKGTIDSTDISDPDALLRETDGLRDD